MLPPFQGNQRHGWLVTLLITPAAVEDFSVSMKQRPSMYGHSVRFLAIPWPKSWLCLALIALVLHNAFPFASVRADEPMPFPEPFNTQDAKDQPVPPAELVAKMQVPPGFQVTLFAAEPQVQQPVAITTDGRGRLWVCEMYTYAESKVNFATQLRDRIVILEDGDGDGKSDKRTVFWDGGVRLTAAAVGNGGVWALCAPYLYFIPDANGDDVPDGPPIVKLDGWNDSAVRHNIVNGLTLGPDGWLYGRHGILATSSVGPPGTPASRRARINCGIWRYHPVQESFEVVCHGTTNPWGFDFDQHGEMFFINTVIGHFWHVIPGAHYRRMYGEHFNPRVYSVIEQHADHFHWDTTEAWSDIRKGVTESTKKAGGGHAHSGLMIYQGDNWPAEYRGDVFAINLHGLRINRDRLERDGSGYVAKHAEDFLFANNPWFRGIDLLTGNDGAVYVADWADVGECHENDGVHRSSGRIYKVAYGKPARPAIANVDRASSEQLAGLMSHANDWYPRQARRVLQERAAAKHDLTTAHALLNQQLATATSIEHQLRALWALHVSGGLGDDRLHALSTHTSESVRSWVVRLLGDDGRFEPRDIVLLERLAAADPSPRVRLHIASALSRLPLERRLGVATALAGHSADASDHNLPLMIWYGIEAAVPEFPASSVALARSSRIPLLRQYVVRLLSERLDTHPAPIESLLSAATEAPDASLANDVLVGLSEGLRGWRRAPQPRAWPAFAARAARTEEAAIRDRLRELGALFGDGLALDQLRQIALDPNAGGESRRAALRAIIEGRPDDLAAFLKRLAGDRNMLGAAARGLGVLGDPETPKMLLDRWSQLSAEDQRAAVETLVARPAYAAALLDAVANKRLPPSEISAWHARQIRGLNDPRLNERLRELWGEVRETSEDRAKQLEQLRSQLAPERLAKADLDQGRAVFEKVCGNCHALFGKGNAIGPDLTGANRGNLQYLLENIVDPSASVAADFRTSTVVLTDGRVVTGVVSNPTPRTIAVQTATEKLTLPAADVEQVKPTNQSLMPEGLFNTLSADQVRDLIAFLMLRAPGQR
ncbi:MAG: hypothetical protein RLY70_2264 [Planctomycetota bacterium]